MMNKVQLSRFKQDIAKIRTFVDVVAKHWQSHGTDVISVLLQNAAANSEGTWGYTLDKELERTKTAIDAIKAMCNYNKYHLTAFILEEIEFAEMSSTVDEHEHH